ncbi:MAG: hypothetical protein ABFS28_11170 [Bacteroidota bacterium]
MTRIFLLSLPVFLSFLFSCSGTHNNLDRIGLKGQVKSVKEVECGATYEDDKWVAGEDCARVYRMTSYTQDGNYISIMTLDNRNDTLGIARMRFEDGEMVEEVYYQKVFLTPKHSKLVKDSRTVMDRVSSDQVNFEVWQNDVLRYEGATYFDSKGRIDKQVEVVNDRETMVYYVYEKDLLVENYQLELDGGSRIATQLYEYDDYDDHGNWTTKLVYLGEEKITPKVVITRTLDYY